MIRSNTETLIAAMRILADEIVSEDGVANAAIREAAERLEELHAGVWQPIETAPKDGTWVLLSGCDILYGWDGDSTPGAVVGQYTELLNGRHIRPRWQFAWYDSGYYGEYEHPTHWMPLPNTALTFPPA